MLSVILPAYNEAASLPSALEQVTAFLSARGLDGEVIVVNDGSTDATEQTARGLAARDRRVKVISYAGNRGKGCAVRVGMANASGDYRMFLDVDMATPVKEIDKALPLLEEGADLVIGSRHLAGSRIDRPQPLARRLMGRGFRTLASGVLGLGVSDVTCGFKAVSADAAEALWAVLVEDGWAFDAELIHVARKWSLRIQEIPVQWRASADTTVAPIAAAWDAFWALARIRQRDRRGAYGRVGLGAGP